MSDNKDRQGVALSDADLAKELWAEICELPDRYWSESEKEACISNFSEFLGCVERVMERRAISHASSSQGVALSDAVRAVKQLCNEIKQSLDIIDKRHGVCGATEAIHEKADAIVSVLDSRASSSRAEVERKAIGYVNLETLDFSVAFYRNEIPEGYVAVYLAAAEAPNAEKGK